MKIKSKTDVITNSSTEVFTVVDDSLLSKLQTLVDELLGPGASERFEFKLDYRQVFAELYEDNVKSLNEFMKDNGISAKDLEEFIGMSTTGPKYEILKEWFEGLIDYENPCFPNIAVIPKDSKDAEIAKAIGKIPWIAEHGSYYC